MTLRNLFQKPFWTVMAFCLLIVAFGCEKGTHAFGVVMESGTENPIAGARVIEIAIHKKTQQFVAEGVTDSTGTFDFSNGLTSFGLKSTRLVLLIDKEGYRPATVPLGAGQIVISLTPY